MDPADVPLKRPDVLDLIGPEFDRVSEQPARRTLIICSAPRTGSHELCRFLLAAGIGVPHEYFHDGYARRLAERWAFGEDPTGEAALPRYIDVLRRRRAQGGVFATKLQFAHFDAHLRNRHGAALFDGACVVHLFRPDVATQYASFRAARESGTWDFSSRQTTQPITRDRSNFNEFVSQAMAELDALLSEDPGFRGLFVLLGIRPIFVTTDELFRDPRAIVRQIAGELGMPVDGHALEHAIAASAPYGRDRDRKKSVKDLREAFMKIAFRKPL